MTDASSGPPGLGKFGSTYPAYSDVGGPDMISKGVTDGTGYTLFVSSALHARPSQELPSESITGAVNTFDLQFRRSPCCYTLRYSDMAISIPLYSVQWHEYEIIWCCLAAF